MKKIIIISLIAGGFYVARKFNTTNKILSNLKTKISNVSSVNVQGGFVNLKIDLNITNLSNFDLSINTYNLLAIKQLRFYNAKNRLLVGTANVNISNIQIPSKEEIVLADILVKIPANNILKNLSLLSVNLSDTLRVVPVFNAGGKEFEINPENYV
ncbi:hypothetical protein [Polaribacter aestuariivivens]|uniref:hypothetical protein n=1 Tax=Polaribacter aestuariivivens TaxID=2304626 RepID=UPI003F4951A3